MRQRENDVWEEVVICLRPGDILTSKKGFLSPKDGKAIIYKKMEYKGNGCFIIRGDKKIVELTKKEEGEN